MSFEVSTSVKLNPRVRHRRVGDDGVVVCMHLGSVLVVNPVGAHIVEQLNKQLTIAEIIESICKEFDVSNEIASRDLNVYLEQLHEQGVVSVNSDGAL